ncbi:preprotein translocase subunit YajC [Bifidobacterium oedipodis]|uniref:Preprotein translocase, YajC subunit n=1 Tax=Bifidobacterium oedipodis TaxID=2675322 RepID=A0A7Y0EPT8_9BIFI|nr:preprotein translocase subunit YajC [Bifidobacterium sp. DSM 109957]NMM94214.1 preprotein translocase, YajC subunit [Bifidobacterium sp. DSM 109957]
MEYMSLILILVVFGGMMWWQSRKAKQQQAEKQDFRRNLKPGTEVITIGQVIGKVVEVDEQYEEIVIDSEGSKLRFGFNAIAREYVRPAYVSDEEYEAQQAEAAESDADATADDEPAQVAIEASLANNNADVTPVDEATDTKDSATK